MSHTVIQMDSKVSSSTKASNLKTQIKDYLLDQGFDLHDNQVNDGSDLEDTPTLRVKTDHNNTTEANIFFDWLEQFSQDNKAEYDKDNNVEIEGFTRFRLTVHDCKHLAGLQEPCEIGNSTKYDLRPEA